MTDFQLIMFIMGIIFSIMLSLALIISVLTVFYESFLKDSVYELKIEHKKIKKEVNYLRNIYEYESEELKQCSKD